MKKMQKPISMTSSFQCTSKGNIMSDFVGILTKGLEIKVSIDIFLRFGDYMRQNNL